MIILPRQARDKHRENSKKDRFVAVLAAIFGWRAVAYVYGAAVAAFSIFWQFKVTNGPGSTGSGKPPLASPAQEEASGAAARKSAAQGGADSSVNTQIFGVRAAQVIMLMHWNANFTEITLLQWAPTYLNQALGVPLAQLGKYLLAPALIEQVANIGAASAESLLLARGISTLTLRRAACVAASLTQALGMLLFGLARSPALASLAMCMVRSGDCLHNSGYNVNYLEVGGKDTALLSAVGNCAASAPGFIIPPLSLALRRMSGGGWLGVFIVPAVLQAVCASLYVKYASLAPARATLDDKTA
jgi:ACS family sodium-dependent inorganic phosphate cotransporter